IFDYSRFMDVSNRQIAVPKNQFRQFRIVIGSLTAEQQSQLLELTRRLHAGTETERVENTSVNRRPFRIDRIDLWRGVAIPQFKGEKKAEYPAAKFQVSTNSANRQTVVDVETRREPLTSVVVETETQNFSRQASVLMEVTTGVKKDWRPIAQSRISRT